MENNIVPPTTTGKNVDLQETVKYATGAIAVDTFKRACKRLLNPPVWHKLSGRFSAAFFLVDNDGKVLERMAEQGDYFCIDVPGPGPSLGDGYDWVKLELIQDKRDTLAEEESFSMRLRASNNPSKATKDTAHFFRETATSSFVISRKHNTVTVSYYGRNEQPNTSTEKTSDNVRNAMAAIGAAIGLSEIQWKTLIKAFLQDEIGG